MAKGHRQLVVVVTTMTLIVGLVVAAGAAPDKKQFETGITPLTSTAGTAVDYVLTITNTSDAAPLGAAQITVPDGFYIVSVAVEEDRNWSLEEPVGNPFRILADDIMARLAPGQSISVTISAVTPLQGGDTNYTFDVEARQANNFNGNRNDLNGVGPTVEVTGTATACETGQSCTAGFSAGRTSAQVETTCLTTDCGNLILDLDKGYCDDPATCAGEGVFWVPPAISESGVVELEILIPRSEFDGGVGQIRFFIAPTGASEAVECGSAADTTGCSYKVTPAGRNLYQIAVTVDQVDPRAFAS